MIEDLDGVADVIALVSVCEDVVDDHVICGLKWTAGKEGEWSKRVVALVVDAVNDLWCAGAEREVLNDRRGDSNVRQLAEGLGILGRYGCATDGVDEAGVGWAHDHVRADAVGADLL